MITDHAGLDLERVSRFWWVYWPPLASVEAGIGEQNRKWLELAKIKNIDVNHQRSPNTEKMTSYHAIRSS